MADRTSEQVESVADKQMEDADQAYWNDSHIEAQKLRDEAIFSMLRAILLAIKEVK